MYATPLFSCGPQNFTSNTADTTSYWDGVLYTTGVSLWVSKNTQVGGSGGVGPQKKLVIGTNLGASLTSLQTFLYTSTTNHTDGYLTALHQPACHSWMPACISAGDTWRGVTLGDGTNAIEWTSASTLGKAPFTTVGSQAMAGRVVYATFPEGTGQFTTIVRTPSNGTVLATATTSTNTLTLGYQTKVLNFTSHNNTAGNLNLTSRFSWDGDNQSAPTYTLGPVCWLWASVCQIMKGYSVSNLNGYSGANTTVIKDTLMNSVHGTRSFLKEIKERQVASGGSGRALVWINAGINLDATPATWVANMDILVDFIMDNWVAVGGVASKMAFAISVTHPMTTSVGPGTDWFTNRAAVAAAAWKWGASAGANISVVDLAVLFPGRTMMTGALTAVNAASGTMYDSVNQVHLRHVEDTATNGYNAMSYAVIEALTANT